MKAKIYYLFDKNDLSKTPRYIGKTKHLLKRRLYEHIWYCKRYQAKKYLNNWLNSINFNADIGLVEECDHSIWQEREIYWIAYYRSIGDNLTNTTEGGEGVDSESLAYDKNPKAKKVLQYDLEGNFINKFNSIREAAEKTNTSSTKISDCVCLTRVKKSGDFIWKYYEENYPLKIEAYVKIPPNMQELKKKVYKYVNGELIKEYSSIRECAIDHNIHYSNMKSILKKRKLYKKEIFFTFVNKYNPIV